MALNKVDNKLTKGIPPNINPLESSLILPSPITTTDMEIEDHPPLPNNPFTTNASSTPVLPQSKLNPISMTMGKLAPNKYLSNPKQPFFSNGSQECPLIDTMESKKDERRGIVDKLQKPNKYDRLLPYYASSLERETADHWQNIKEGLGRAVLGGNARPGILHWAGQLHLYTLRHSLRFTSTDHVTTIRTLYDLVSRADLDADVLDRVTLAVTELLKRRDSLARPAFGSEPTDLNRAGQTRVPDQAPPVLVLDWEALMDRYEVVVFREEERDASAYGLNHYPKSYGSNLCQLIRLARVYFPPGTVARILTRLGPLACPFDAHRMEQVCHLLELFLPTVFVDDTEFESEFGTGHSSHVNHSRGRGSIGLVDQLLDLYASYESFPPWNKHLLSLLARVAQDNVGRCSWTEAAANTVFTKFLANLNLPLSGKTICHKTSNHTKVPVQESARWIIYAMAGPGPENDHVQPKLTRLLLAIESYTHPSNSGKWTGTLVKFVNSLVRNFMDRLYLERHKVLKWGTPVPDRAKLSDQQIETFVSSLGPIIFLLMFDKQAYRNITFSVKDLVSLSPKTMIPPLMEKIYLSFETVLEPHRLRSCLAAASVLGLALTRYQPFATPAPTGLDDVSDDVVVVGECHAMTVLDYALPGIDPNDPVKCISSLLLICTQSCLIPAYDFSAWATAHDHVGPPKPAHLVELALASRTSFEDYTVRLLERCFDLAASLDNSSVDAGGFMIASGSREDTGGVTAIKSRDEASLSVSIMGAANTVLRQCSPPIYLSVVKFGFERIKRTLYASKAARDAIADLCHGMCLPDPDASLPLLVPHLLSRIGDCLQSASYPPDQDGGAHDHDHSQSNPEFLWYAQLLGSTLKNVGTGPALKFGPDILTVLGPALTPRAAIKMSLEAYELLCEALCNLLGSVTKTYINDYRSLNPGEWERYVVDPDGPLRLSENYARDVEDPETFTPKSPLDLWGRVYLFKEVDFRWHVPNEAGLAFASSTLDRFLKPTLDFLDGCSTKADIPGATDVKKGELHKRLCLVEKCLMGTAAVTPSLLSHVTGGGRQQGGVGFNDPKDRRDRPDHVTDSSLLLIRRLFDEVTYPVLTVTTPTGHPGSDENRMSWVRTRIVDSIHALLSGPISARLADDYSSLGYAISSYRSALFYRGYSTNEIDQRCQSYKSIKLYSSDRFRLAKRLPRFAHALRAQIQHEIYCCKSLDSGFCWDGVDGEPSSPSRWHGLILGDMVRLSLRTEYKGARDKALTLLDEMMSRWPVVTHTLILETLGTALSDRATVVKAGGAMGTVHQGSSSDKGTAPPVTDTSTQDDNFAETVLKILMGRSGDNCMTSLGYFGTLDRAFRIIYELPLPDKQSLVDLWDDCMDRALSEGIYNTKRSIRIPRQLRILALKLSKGDHVSIENPGPLKLALPQESGCDVTYPVYAPVFVPRRSSAQEYDIFSVPEQAASICARLKDHVSAKLSQNDNWRYRFVGGQMLAVLVLFAEHPLDPVLLRHFVSSCMSTHDSPPVKNLYLCHTCSFLRILKLPYPKTLFSVPPSEDSPSDAWARALCYGPQPIIGQDHKKLYMHKTAVGYYYAVSDHSELAMSPLLNPTVLKVLDAPLIDTLVPGRPSEFLRYFPDRSVVRGGTALGLEELYRIVVYECSASHVVSTFVSKLADSEDTDIEFDPIRVNLLKGLFRNHGPDLTNVYLDFLEGKMLGIFSRSVTTADSEPVGEPLGLAAKTGKAPNSLSPSFYCVASEIFTAWLRATKYWPAQLSAASFSRYKVLIERGILDQLSPENVKFWRSAFLTVADNRDPTGLAPLVELFLERILARSGSSHSSAGSTLNTSLVIKMAYEFFGQFQWKVGSVHWRLAHALTTNDGGNHEDQEPDPSLSASGSKNIEGAVGQILALPFVINEYSDSYTKFLIPPPRNHTDGIGNTLSGTTNSGSKSMESSSSHEWWKGPTFAHYFETFVTPAMVSYIGSSVAATILQQESSKDPTAEPPTVAASTSADTYVDRIGSLFSCPDVGRNRGLRWTGSAAPSNAENRLKTYVKVLNTYVQHSLKPLSGPVVLSLPLLFHMEKGTEARDPHWSREIANLRLFVSRTVLPAPGIGTDPPLLLTVLARTFTANPTWKVRALVLEFLRDATFTNSFGLVPWAGLIWNFCLAALLDPVLEVQERGREALSGLIHCKFLPFEPTALVDRFNALIEYGSSTGSLVGGVGSFVKDVLLLRLKDRRATAASALSGGVKGETATVDKACCASFYDDADTSDPLGLLAGAVLQEGYGSSSNPPGRTRFYLAGLLGLCGLVEAFPYTIPPHLPHILVRLSSLSHRSSVGPNNANRLSRYSNLIRKTMASFKRTHLDNWHQEHKAKFSEEELEVLSDLLVSPNYYA